MKRTGFFARIAQAAAVPVAIAVGRALPAAQPFETATLRGEVGVDEAAAPLMRVANITGELSPNGAANLMERGFTHYIEHYGDGATSLIRSLASLAR